MISLSPPTICNSAPEWDKNNPNETEKLSHQTVRFGCTQKIHFHSRENLMSS
ncbi:hypothetical protein FORC89_p038 (plasmid) [Salmonella sp. FORC89]|nr:hypothetical protein FORC51_p0166 [Salmonella enterica]UWN40166.1 hypothetical protein FORC89_p038 [Salmonella sp. FORC89]